MPPLVADALLPPKARPIGFGKYGSLNNNSSNNDTAATVAKEDARSCNGAGEAASYLGLQFAPGARSILSCSRDWDDRETMGLKMSRPGVESFREIDVLRAGMETKPHQAAMADNSVVTSKYNLITFVPRSLFEQFRRVANIYFLVICILMVLGTYTTLFESPLTPYSTLIPLVIVLTITMVKDGVEDLKRHKSDKRVSSPLAPLTVCAFCTTITRQNAGVRAVVHVTKLHIYFPFPLEKNMQRA